MGDGLRAAADAPGVSDESPAGWVEADQLEAALIAEQPILAGVDSEYISSFEARLLREAEAIRYHLRGSLASDEFRERLHELLGDI
jgi:hypothetical protein